MKIFETRYKANKEKKTSPYYSTSDRVVKVEGGYTIMSEQDYRVWKLQK